MKINFATEKKFPLIKKTLENKFCMTKKRKSGEIEKQFQNKK